MRHLSTAAIAIVAALVSSAARPVAAQSEIGLPAIVDLAAAGGVRFDGPAGSSGFGSAALAMGDVDGDGAPDVVVGAPKAEGGRGAVYVFFGRSGVLPASHDLASSAADLTIVGAGPSVGLGVAAVAADLDADGASELVVSTTGYVPALGRLASGGALIFHGGAALRARTRIDLGVDRADASVSDAAIVGVLGASLAAGDFDGDGYPDLVVGDPLASGLGGAARAGRAIILFGGAVLPFGRAIDASDAAVAIVGGKSPGDLLGSDVSVADVTGDSRDDVLLGTPNRTVVRAVPSEKAGSAFVVSGRSLAPGARIDLAADGATIEVLGAEYGDYLGRGIGAGDVTGDRVPDLVVSAIDGDGPANGRYPDCGEIYVLEAPVDAHVDLLQAPQWQWIIGDSPRRFTGDTLAVADVDGDRRSEIVGASESASGPNGASSGALYIVDGTVGTLDLASESAPTTIVGPSSGARLGSALAVADLDGDGVADVAAGAPGALGGRGSVFVVAGVRTEPDAAPVIAAVPDVHVQAGSSFTVMLRATDADGDPIRLAILGRPAGSVFVDAGDGTASLTITPELGATGHFDVVVVASDGQLGSRSTFTIDIVAGPVPRVTKAMYRNGALKVTGDNFQADSTMSVDGSSIDRPVVFKPAHGRLVVRGSASELHLHPGSGSNTIVVTTGGVASEPFAF